MPRKKKPGSRGTSPEKMMQSGPIGNQYGSESSSWIGVNQTGSSHVHSSEQEQTFHHVQDIFKGSLDAEVVYMVLSECDWKVEDTIEKLLQMVPQVDDSGSGQSSMSMKTVADSLHYNVMNPMQSQQTPGSQPVSQYPSHQPAMYPQLLNQQMSPQIPVANVQNQGAGNLQVNVRSRLPSAHQQDGGEVDLPMLSPRTPSTARMEFPSFGQENNSREHGMQSALDALDSYANRTTTMPSYNRTNSTYGNIGLDLFDLGGLNDYNKGSLYPNNTGNNLHSPSQHPQNQFGQGIQGQDLQHMFQHSQQQLGTYSANDGTAQDMNYSGQRGSLQHYAPNTAHLGSKVDHNRTMHSGQYQNTFDQNLNVTSQYNTGSLDHSYATSTDRNPNLTPMSHPPPAQQRSPTDYTPTAPGFSQKQNVSFSVPPNVGESVVSSRPPSVPKPQPTKHSNGQQEQAVEARRIRQTTILRKQAISLDPQERESLEKLIEEVIIDGVGADIMDDESTSSEDDADSTVSPSTEEAPPTDSKKDGKQDQDAKQGSEKSEPQPKGKKGKKNGKDESSGKAHPSHLKVAAKHMKNLPPRFLRRLQVAQKQGEIKVDGTIEGLAELGLVPQEVLEEAQREREMEKEQEREREKEAATAKEKKKAEQPKKPRKKRNLLESLDPYFDDVDFTEEDTSVSGQTALDHTPEKTEHSDVQYEKSPNYSGVVSNDHTGLLQTPEKMGMLDLSPHSGPPSRTSPKPNMQQQMLNSPNIVLRQTAMNCEDLERELMAQRLHNHDEGMGYMEPPNPNRIMAPGVSRDIFASNGGSGDHLDRWSQFSVDAPEFIPRTFTPITPAMPGPEMLGDQQQAPRLTVSQPFVKAGSPFQALQAPVGRMSPQIMPPQVAAAQLATQGRQSPTFLLPKATAAPPPPIQAHPGMGVISYPYPMPASFPYPPGYGQLPYRAPFLPPGGTGAYPTSWSPDSKGPEQKGARAQSQSYAFNAKPGQQHIWSQNVHGVKLHTSPVPNARMGSPNMRRHADPRYSEPHANKHAEGGVFRGPRGGNVEGKDEMSSTKERIENMARAGQKVLILMRGPPGSGKSTLARELQFNGVVLTTDDFFMRGESYEFDVSRLGEAHEWNQKRAKEAMESGRSPVIIDNTNTQSWEMKAYTTVALKNDYKVEILEPNTPWMFKARELAKRNTHGVTYESIQRMIDRYEHNVTVTSIVGTSARPKDDTQHRQQQMTPQQQQQQQQSIQQQQQQSIQQSDPQDPDQQQPPKKHKKRRRKRKRGRKNHGGGEEKHDDNKQASSEDESTPDREADSSQDTTTPHKSDPQIGQDQDSGNIEKHLLETSEKASKALISQKSRAEDDNHEDGTDISLENAEKVDIEIPKDSITETDSIPGKGQASQVSSVSSNGEIEKFDESKEEIDSEKSDIVDEEKDGIMEKETGMLNQNDNTGAREPSDVILGDEDVRNIRQPTSPGEQSIEETDTDTHVFISKEISDLELKEICAYSENARFSESDELLPVLTLKEMSPDGEMPSPDESNHQKEFAADREDRKDQSSHQQESATDSEELTDQSSHQQERATDREDRKDQSSHQQERATDSEKLTDQSSHQQERATDSEKPSNQPILQQDIASDNEEQPDQSIHQHNIATESRESLDQLSHQQNIVSDSVETTDQSSHQPDIVSDSVETTDHQPDKATSSIEPRQEEDIPQFEENLILEPGQIIEAVEKTLKQIKKKKKEARRECILEALHEQVQQFPIPNEIREEIREIIQEKVSEGMVNQEVAQITSNASSMGYSDRSQSSQNQSSQNILPSQSEFDGLLEEVSSDPANQFEIDRTEEESFQIDLDKEYEEYMKQLQKQMTDSCTIEESYWSKSGSGSDPYEVERKSAPILYETPTSWGEGSTSLDGWSIPKPQRATTPDSWKIPEPQRNTQKMQAQKRTTRSSNTEAITSTDLPVQPSMQLPGTSTPPSHPQTSARDVRDPGWDEPSVRSSPARSHKPAPRSSAPQLDPQTKEQLLTAEWQLPTFDTVHIVAENHPVVSPVSCSHVATYTHPRDFAAFHANTQDLSDKKDQDFIRIVNTVPREIVPKHLVVYDERQASPSRSHKLTLEKSCATTDLESSCSDNGIEFLKNCFPAVSEHDLSDILKQCEGDIEWAVNLMLDAGYEYNEPSTHKETVEPSCAASPDTEEVTQEMGEASAACHTPLLPLVLLCQEALSPTSTLMSNQVQDQVSRSSYSRLQSIEEFQQNRSLSSPESNHSRLQRSTLSTGSYDDPFETSPRVATVPSLGLLGESPAHLASLGLRGDTAEETATDGVDSQLLGEVEESCHDKSMTLTLSPALATQLISMFGPVGFHISADSMSAPDFNVVLNRQAARQIHRRWALTLQNKFDSEEIAIHRMISQDEALARQLQEEENSLRQTPLEQEQVAPSPVKTSILPGMCVVRSSSPPSSLKEIMEEQMAMELSRKEYIEQVSSVDREATIATKMKRQQLYNMYPDVDAPTLHEVFQANNYDLGATVAAVQASLGMQERPNTIMTPEAMLAYEEEQVKKATQQSLQQQWLGVTEEEDVDTFQTLSDPNYQDFRAEASMHYRLRHECFQKAQEAYRRNMKGAASFYSQQGHLHTNKLKEANSRAADKIMEIRNDTLNTTNKIDLHGLHVDEAVHALEAVLVQRETEIQERPDKRKLQLYVVTGRGNHSRGGVAKIKPAICDYLNRNKYSFIEQHSGLLRVTLKYREPSH